MDNFEPIEAFVKFQTLIQGVDDWIPMYPTADALRWLNAWLGPHWIFVPTQDSVIIMRDGGMVYRGKLCDLPASKAALDHTVDLKMLDEGLADYVRMLVSDLEETLQAILTSDKPAEEVAAGVATFFQFHQAQAQAAGWFSQ